MNLFLRLKHWHYFVVLFAFPQVISLFYMQSLLNEMRAGMKHHTPSFNLHENLEGLIWVFAVGILFSLLIYCWYVSLALGLRKYTPEKARLKVAPFAIAAAISGIGSVFMMLKGWELMSMVFNLIETRDPDFNQTMWSFMKTFLLIGSITYPAMLYALYYTAKAYKNATTGVRNTFSNVIAEFIMLLFWYIGVWMIQPKVNALLERGEWTKEMEENQENE
ncbi:MAG: hypothetical protein LPK45_08350 [Bacteroidota bacterium]|nr:hypothetical protein [Bacteroidota bacterium]MDX5431078.1 hypothetical protein [Bacteroidota bacterium]MDX5469832.1 hypothetical protein [Bacteroidota bacterium]